jgi:hypothetical protein
MMIFLSDMAVFCKVWTERDHVYIVYTVYIAKTFNYV